MTNTKVQAHKVGYAANSFYVYQQVYDENGKPIENMFVDRNGNGTIDGGDRSIYKKPAGDVLMGLTSKMQYKNFDFSFSLRASLNNYVYYDFPEQQSQRQHFGICSPIMHIATPVPKPSHSVSADKVITI